MAPKVKGPLSRFRNTPSYRTAQMCEEHPDVGYDNAYRAVVNGYPHYVRINTSGMAAVTWCNLNSITTMQQNDRQFFFRTDEEAVMFKLAVG